MTRVSLPALAGATILAAGFLAASVPAQAACVGIANCANAGGNRFATTPGIARPGVNLTRPGPTLNGAGVIGMNGASILHQNGGNMIGRNGSGFGR